MAPPSPRPGHGLLRCPICRLGLGAAAGALVCPNRHSFDIARDGYVNLLRGGGRRPKAATGPSNWGIARPFWKRVISALSPRQSWRICGRPPRRRSDVGASSTPAAARAITSPGSPPGS
ncbi:MAG TPA: hypothetical protein VJ770_02050, partial [Stellaceae bacterium]|nr:hypothetical protein [Stellaceae bacterium]